MKNETVYLTFPTDRLTSDLLKLAAQKFGKTQPELINEICQGYVSNLLDILEEKGFLKLDLE